jgi:hypothetical protein
MRWIAGRTPSIDAFSPKNQAMDEPTVESIRTAAGLRAGRAGRPAFTAWTVPRTWSTGDRRRSRSTGCAPRTGTCFGGVRRPRGRGNGERVAARR